MCRGIFGGNGGGRTDGNGSAGWQNYIGDTGGKGGTLFAGGLSNSPGAPLDGTWGEGGFTNRIGG
jgi:hypothetical protein